MKDAAHHPRGIERLIERAAGIDRLDAHALESAALLMKIPPGYSVLRGDEDGAGSEQRYDLRRRRRQGIRLQGQDHQILLAELCGAVARGDLHPARRARLGECQAARPDRRELRAAGHHAHRQAGARQLRRHVAADRAGAEDGDPHGVESVLRSLSLIPPSLANR